MSIIKSFIKKIFNYQAQLVLKKYNPKIVTIIGSVGKSTTRDALYSILSKKTHVRKSQKSFTAELGVALTILGCFELSGSVLEWLRNIFRGFNLIIFKSKYPDWLILEIDGDKMGDLSNISSWIKPDVVLLTAVGEVPSHIEMFPSLESFIKEKTTFLNSIKREGFLIFNADDSQALKLALSTSIEKISCGVGNTTDNCQVVSSLPNILYSPGPSGYEWQIPIGISFDIQTEEEKGTITGLVQWDEFRGGNGLRRGSVSRYDDEHEPVSNEEIRQVHKSCINIFGSIGTGNIYACLLAVAFAKKMNIPLSEVGNIFKNYSLLPGRMRLISGMNDSLIVDDSYNSSPIALVESLEDFFAIEFSENCRKIIVLGDMFELGKFSAEEHKKIARILSIEKYKSQISKIICVGVRMYDTIDELLNFGFDESMVTFADDYLEASKELKKDIKPGDLIFIKGSQSMRLEKVVAEVMRYPEDATKLLVRQDVRWQGKE